MSAADEQLSAYELQRAENIRRNEEELARLGLSGGIVPQPAQLQKAQSKKRPKREPAGPPAEPERRSARSKGEKAPGFYVEQELSRGSIKVGGDAVALQQEAAKDKARRAEAAQAADPLSRFGVDANPEEEEHLLEGEKFAFRALVLARRARSSELQIEGYKICHNRSLCEMVRRLPTNAAELGEIWGFGGSGKRVKDHGEVFLDVLRPRVAKLKGVHEEARKQWEAGAEARAASAAVVAAEVEAERPLVELELLEMMPEKADELIDAEATAYKALIDATHVHAEKIGERYVWNIALSRTLCEMTRRCPRTIDELRECWGMGGSGVRAARHGHMLLAALEPHIAEIEAAHEAARAAASGSAGADDASAEARAAQPLEDEAKAAGSTSSGRQGKRKAPEVVAPAGEPSSANTDKTQPRRRTRLSSAGLASS